ncbi:MAG: twin-arginine translocase subunit TatC [Cytophagaceae bacterium]|nr:twin-arginine translocase subunit TatC [Cytophagaceae bacterium]
MPLDQPKLDYESDSEAESTDGTEMSFLDHLEALRWHIIRAAAAIIVFTVLAFVFLEQIYNKVILGPARPSFWTYRMFCKLGEFVHAPGLCIDKLDFKLISFQMSGQFSMAMLSSFIIGLVFTFPYAFWEVWRFVAPGLKPSERRAARGAVFYVTMLFFIGVLFGYYVVSPLAINFLANFKIDESIINQFDIGSYISVLATLTLACGLTFQLPMIVLVLSQVGILTPSFMREYRRHAYVIILILSGVITPSPDLTSQILVAAPLTLLYEVSIGVSARVNKRRMRELGMNEA